MAEEWRRANTTTWHPTQKKGYILDHVVLVLRRLALALFFLVATAPCCVPTVLWCLRTRLLCLPPQQVGPDQPGAGEGEEVLCVHGPKCVPGPEVCRPGCAAILFCFSPSNFTVVVSYE